MLSIFYKCFKKKKKKYHVYLLVCQSCVIVGLHELHVVYRLQELCSWFNLWKLGNYWFVGVLAI